MKTLILISLLLILNVSTAATLLAPTELSYAEEYKQLRILLEKVKDVDTALHYKPAIEKEIQQLNQNQVSGSEQFDLLSNKEKALFVKRFQRNRFHCGEVTQVMVERRRILFDPKLFNVLADTLANIP